MNGNGNEYISVGYDENMGKEIKYSQWTHEESKYVDFELETNKTRRKDHDVKMQTERKSGIHNADEINKRYEKEKECKENTTNEQEEKTEVRVEDIDDNTNNDTHAHITDERLEEEAKKAKISIEAFKKEYEKAEGSTVEEKIENAQETIEEQFIGTKERR